MDTRVPPALSASTRTEILSAVAKSRSPCVAVTELLVNDYHSMISSHSIALLLPIMANDLERATVTLLPSVWSSSL